MVATLICPTSCGFPRVAALQIGKEITSTAKRAYGEESAKFGARLMQEHYKLFTALFKDQPDNFKFEFLKFQKKMPALRLLFSNWNPRKKAEKEKYLETFSIENWKNISSLRKKEHSFENCKGCYHHYLEIMSLLPVRSNQFKGMINENPFRVLVNVKEKTTKSYSDKEVKETVRALYNKIDVIFHKSCSVSFADALVKVPELKLQKKKSPIEIKKERRDMYRKCKNKVEDEWEKTSLLRYKGFVKGRIINLIVIVFNSGI